MAGSLNLKLTQQSREPSNHPAHFELQMGCRRAGGPTSETTEIPRPMRIGLRWSEAPSLTESSDCTVYSICIQSKPKPIRPLGRRASFHPLATVNTRLTTPKQLGFFFILSYVIFESIQSWHLMHWKSFPKMWLLCS